MLFLVFVPPVPVASYYCLHAPATHPLRLPPYCLLIIMYSTSVAVVRATCYCCLLLLLCKKAPPPPLRAGGCGHGRSTTIASTQPPQRTVTSSLLKKKGGRRAASLEEEERVLVLGVGRGPSSIAASLMHRRPPGRARAAHSYCTCFLRSAQLIVVTRVFLASIKKEP